MKKLRVTIHRERTMHSIKVYVPGETIPRTLAQFVGPDRAAQARGFKYGLTAGIELGAELIGQYLQVTSK